MKTFDEKDLITWANRDKAVIGNEYYFASSLDAMECYINNEPSRKRKLIKIDKNSCSYTFENSRHNYYACILPVDAVKEPEKKYRACKTIQEFCKLVTSNTTIQPDGPDGQRSLIGCIVHIRNKITDAKYSTAISNIAIGMDNCVRIELTPRLYEPLKVIFENYEIEINGEWLPIGVLEE